MKNNKKNGSSRTRRATIDMIYLIADSLRDAIIMMNHIGAISYWNPAAERIFGFIREEAIGKNLHSMIVSPENNAAHQKAFPMFQKTGRGDVIGKTIELEALRKDGKIIKIQLSLSALEIDGEWHAIGIVRDDTERSFHLEKLQRQADVLDSAVDGIAYLGIDQKYEYVNPAHAEIYGYEIADLLGKSWRILYRDEELEIFEQEIFPILVEKGFFQGESVGMKKDRSLFPQELSLRILNGKMTCIVRDITGKKKAEEEKRELESGLEHARKMESIGLLASGIAHNLNNRLGVILGEAEMTQVEAQGSSFGSVALRMKRIIEEVQKGANVIKDLLKFASRKSQNIKPMDIGKLVRERVALFAAVEKAICITEEYERDLWSVDADISRIEDVLMNLLVNAGHAVAGKGKIHVETKNIFIEKEEAILYGLMSGRYVSIAVIDDGIGIPDEIKEKIFDPFFTTKDVDIGTGLGLSTVYGTMQAHKGAIVVKSQQGEGAEVTIFLPASDKKIILNRDIESVEVKGGGGNILLVDDEETTLEVAKTLLVYMGYDVYPCKSGEEAINACQKDSCLFDLVIMDMTMPRMTGREALVQLRKINPNLKALLLSGYNLQEEVDKKGGFDGFLQKPYGMKEFAKEINKILEK